MAVARCLDVCHTELQHLLRGRICPIAGISVFVSRVGDCLQFPGSEDSERPFDQCRRGFASALPQRRPPDLYPMLSNVEFPTEGRRCPSDDEDQKELDYYDPYDVVLFNP